jgi:rubrerythrin
MFEVFREKTYDEKYAVVYFTELNEHNRDEAITHALEGETFYSGYLKEIRKEEAKTVIQTFIERLNDGEEIDPSSLEEALKPFLAA